MLLTIIMRFILTPQNQNGRSLKHHLVSTAFLSSGNAILNISTSQNLLKGKIILTTRFMGAFPKRKTPPKIGVCRCLRRAHGIL